MTASGRYIRRQIPVLNAHSACPEQQIVDSVETEQLSANHTITQESGAAHHDLTVPQHTRTTVRTASDSPPGAATIIRRDSFSRTRNDDDEDILMHEDEDEDSGVTQIRIEEDINMHD